jgi:hypothetical protein
LHYTLNLINKFKLTMHKIRLTTLLIIAVSSILLGSCKKADNTPADSSTAKTADANATATNLSTDTSIRVPLLASIKVPKGIYKVVDFGKMSGYPLNRKGNNGIAIPNSGDMVIKVNEKTFTFSKWQYADQVIAQQSTIRYMPAQITISATDSKENAQIVVTVAYLTPGTYLIKEVLFTFDGVGIGGPPTLVTYSSLNYNGGGYINLQTVNLGSSIYITTKGTFDAVVGYRSGIWAGGDQMRISGAFDVELPRF